MFIFLFSINLFINSSVFDDNLQKMRDSKKYSELIKIQLRRAEIELSSQKIICPFATKLLTDVLRDAGKQNKSFSIGNPKNMRIFFNLYEKCFDLRDDGSLFDEQFAILKNSYFFEEFITSAFGSYNLVKINSKILIASQLACYLNTSSNGLKLRKKLISEIDIFLTNNPDVNSYTRQNLYLVKSCGNNGIQN